MFFGIITDCDDRNAAGRQKVRVQSLFGVTPTVIGARQELEAAGHLIDILDAGNGEEGVILVNIAPRSGDVKEHWQNGTPFGSFRIGKTIVLSSIAGSSLSLAKKLNLATRVWEFDIPTVMAWAVSGKLLRTGKAAYIEETQFRSYEFLPRVAKWLVEGRQPPAQERLTADFVPDAPSAVWFVDYPFGNCKTTLLEGDECLSDLAILPFYQRLSEVPNNGLPAWVKGSSGLGNKRWLEIVVQGRSASQALNLEVGSLLDEPALD